MFQLAVVMFQLNPQHAIPVLVDGDFIISESRAAATYLVNTYGQEGCTLYPSDTKLRAVIDQRLYFDIGTFYRALEDCFVSLTASDWPISCLSGLCL